MDYNTAQVLIVCLLVGVPTLGGVFIVITSKIIDYLKDRKK